MKNSIDRPLNIYGIIFTQKNMRGEQKNRVVLRFIFFSNFETDGMISVTKTNDRIAFIHFEIFSRPKIITVR